MFRETAGKVQMAVQTVDYERREREATRKDFLVFSFSSQKCKYLHVILSNQILPYLGKQRRVKLISKVLVVQCVLFRRQSNSSFIRFKRLRLRIGFSAYRCTGSCSLKYRNAEFRLSQRCLYHFHSANAI